MDMTILGTGLIRTVPPPPTLSTLKESAGDPILPVPTSVIPPPEWEVFPEREMMRISPILGTMVLNYDGIRIGKVDDLLISPENDRVEKVILSVNRNMDLGEKRVSLPFKNLDISYWGIYYDVDRDELKALPNFSY
jgi:sporulation protein YlmC with PRC-barrel domain